jgi:RNA polymerase subunit RPABC4/transcription elongation factor Spt4
MDETWEPEPEVKELKYCPACKKYSDITAWKPIMVNCEFGTEHFGEICPRCGKTRVILEPHELRPEPDSNLADQPEEF